MMQLQGIDAAWRLAIDSAIDTTRAQLPAPAAAAMPLLARLPVGAASGFALRHTSSAQYLPSI